MFASFVTDAVMGIAIIILGVVILFLALLPLEVISTLLAFIRLSQSATKATCGFPNRKVHRTSLRSFPTSFLQLLQGSRPILLEKPR
jgi:hypothetical protein